MRGVELGDALNWRRVAARVEINDLLVGMLERKDSGVGGEYGKRGMQFLDVAVRSCSSHMDKPWSHNVDAG